MITHRRALASLPLILVLAAACSAAPSPTPTAEPAPADGGASVQEAWAATAAGRGGVGSHHDYDCPAGGEPHTVWGTDTYTDDSSVCTAAVHIGEITLEDGGSVTIEIAEGQDSYEGTERNGIETSDYAAWPGSFVFVLETD